MPRFFVQGRVSAAIFLLCTTAVQADITAADVRADWDALLAAGGGTLTVGSETAGPGTILLDGVRIETALEDGGTMVMDLGRLGFVEQGDGTVRVEMADSYSFSVSETPEFGPAVEIAVTIGQPDVSVVASGDPGDTTYRFSGPSMSVTLDRIVVDGERQAAAAEAVLSAPEGSYRVMRQGALRTVVTEMTADGMKISASASDMTGDGSFTLSAEMDALVLDSDLSVPDDADFTDMSAAIAAGFASSGRIAYGATAFAFEGAGEGEELIGSGSLQGGSLSSTIDSRAIGYETSSNGLEMRLEGTALPLPQISFALAEGGFGLRVPVAPSEEPAEFSIRTAYRGITLGEEVWGLFDPAGAIPRDPANLVLDLSGTGTLAVDLLDPEAMATLGGPPGELRSVTLNELDLAVGGAQLTGTGAFAFDNADMNSFGGFPAPEGAVDLMLTGGNALLDTLVGMGFVDANEAMGARMMLGLFARPGDGPDSLVSRIEVTRDGQVLANGQRVR